MNTQLPDLITLRITAHSGEVRRVVVTQAQFAAAYRTAVRMAAKVEALVSEVYL